MNYLTLIRAIKQAPDGLFIRHMTDDLEAKLAKLERAKCVMVKLDFDKDFNSGKRFTAITQSPETAPPATIERVQVSFWRDGARKGLFSQQAYKVIPSDKPRDGYLTVELMTGKPYTVAIANTKAVA